MSGDDRAYAGKLLGGYASPQDRDDEVVVVETVFPVLHAIF